MSKPVQGHNKEKRKLQLDEEQGEEEERAKRVRFCHDFENSLFNGELSEVHPNDSLKDGTETDKDVIDGNDKASSSCWHRSAEVLFSYCLEPEATRCIDEFEFSFIHWHQMEENISLSEKEVFEMDVVQCVWDAWQRKDTGAIDEVLAAACEEILKNPFIPSQHHCVNCVYISKKMPEAFSLPKTYKVLIKLLSSSMVQSMMNKPNLSAIFASKLLYRAFIRELEWPIEFIQAFLGDIVGPHAWIEHDSCKDFVLILSTAFQGSIRTISNRYASSEMRKMVQRHFFIILGKILRTDSTRENSSALLKLLMIGAEYEDARLIASSMLEQWINNPVYTNSAKDLLHCIVQKTCSMSKSDSSTVGNLSLLKIKNQHSSIYCEMVSNLLSKRREYAAIALKTLVLVDLTAKDKSNLKNISTILRVICFANSAEHKLATILQELAVNENTRIRLKEFVCRLVRHIGSYINIKALCQGLLQPWEAMVNQNESLKVVWLTEIAELVTAILIHSSATFVMDESIMLIVSLPETSTSSISDVEISKTKKEKLEALEGFSVDLAMFQLEAIEWCANIVALYAPNINQNQFANILKCFLFLGDTQSYFQIGEGVGEIECNLLQLLGSCTRASEEILARVILLGISETYPLTMRDGLSIIESLVWRAAAFHKLFHGSLHAESNQLPLGVMKLASFSLSGHPRESLTNLVYKDMYRRACMVLLLIAVFNPTTIGQYVWEQYSTVRQMMEMVITGNQSYVLSRKQKVGDLESEAINSDAKAEESIYSLIQQSKHITVMGEILPDSDEWRGNITPLSSFGILERLPESIIAELEEADRVYKLGHELRNCRSPDFLAQITSKQTLSTAWRWLRGILFQEPEIVRFLPFLWQCELLYLQEGLVARGGKHFVNFKQLSLKVHNTIIDKSHQKEAKAFVEYLSCKLADKCSIIRQQVRRCFVHIFNTSSTFLTEGSPSPDSGQRFFTPSNTCFDSFNLRGNTLIKTARASNSANYDLRWLEGINAHPHAHTIISSLLPAIQNAVQVETSFEVVVVYLKFLGKYSPPFPSLFSFTCTIAKFLVQRKEFTAHLLSMASDSDSHVVYPSSSVSGKHIYITDFIFNSLYEALRVGTSSQLNDEELAGIKSPLVTFVAPQNDNGDTRCLHRITLHRIVLDAIIHVLSIWTNRENYGKSENTIIESMIQLMAPNIAGKMSVAWLESSIGQRLPLLSEDQAIVFSRSKDDRIALAGYNFLSLNSILELCQGLGVPSRTVDFILEVLDMKFGFRLHELLKSQKPNECQSWTLQSRLQMLSKFTTKRFQKLSWILSQITSANFFFTMPFIVHKSVIATDSVAINGYEEKHGQFSMADMVDLLVTQIAMSGLSFQLGSLSGVPDLILGYGELRKCIQRAVCCDNVFPLLGMIETSFKKFKVFEDHRFSWVYICFFLLPGLAVLTSSAHGSLDSLSELCTKMSQSETVFEAGYKGPFNKILNEMDTELGRNLNVEKTILNIILHTRFIIDEMQHMFEAQYAKPLSLCQKSLFKTMHVNCQESCSPLDSSYASFMGVEGSVHKFLELNLKPGWSENWHAYQPDIFISELLQFILRIITEGGVFSDCIGNLKADDSLGNKTQVMLSGCCGVFSGYLKFLDLCMNSRVWTSLQLFADSGKDVFRGHSFMQLCLENIVHESSWQVMTKSLKSMVEYFERVTPLSCLCGSQRSNPLTVNHLSACSFGKQAEAIAVLEFLYVCSYHPRTALAHWPSLKLENQVSGKSITIRRTSTLSAHCLVNITSVACTSIRIIKSLQCSFKGISSVDKVVCKDLVSLATDLLLLLASNSGDNLHAIVQQLLALDCDEKCDMPMEQASSIHDAVSIGANELLYSVYFAFPFSVCDISQFEIGNVSFTNKMLYGLKILQSSRLLLYRFRQAHPMYTIVQKALKILCEGNEIESDKAYGFCHHLAKNHSLLVLPHILMVAVLLKEKMAGITHGKGHVSSFGHALYLVAGLLDALRPHILYMHNNLETLNGMRCCGLKDNTEEATLGVQQRDDVPKGALEVMMDVYFEVLNNLQAVNLPQYLKVVIRFTDFLCHCVAAGKHCLEVVAIRRTLIESTAQKFSKIKKLGFLLSLIDNHVLLLHSQRTDTNDLLKQSYSEDILSEPPSLPVNVIQRVQSKLQHFLSLNTDESDIYSSMVGRPGEILLQQRNSKNSGVEYENELHSVLDDVEKASARVPMVLTSLEGLLIELTRLQNKDVQNHLYQLLERLLLHCPSKNSRRKVIKAVLRNLKSSDMSIAKMAAQQALKCFHHCPELQETVLVELFLKRSVAEENLQQLLCDLLLITA